MMRSACAFLCVLLLVLTACGGPGAPEGPQRLRLATTTSTADSGLLDAILPGFESTHQAQVEVIAVGSGQALALGANGDVDVVLAHSPAQEADFVARGDGTQRYDVMYNDFVVVGPRGDPAGIAGMALAKEVFARIAAKGALFVSRGDNSGTHVKERQIWDSAGLAPAGLGWYLSVGQGMGETLLFANEKQAYTLADRGTWLAQRTSVPDLALLVGGDSIGQNADPALLNPYGVIPVNPERHPGVNFELATQFVGWLTSTDVQGHIGRFGQDRFGQALFMAAEELTR